MLLKLTTHAQIRLLQRGISVDSMKKAIKEPDLKESAEEGCIKIVKKLSDGARLKVIYKKDGFRDKKDTYIIITAYFLK